MGHFKADQCYPRDHERFHLRLLLLHVPGATGYDDLKTVNGVVHNTFKEACVARGLIAANQPTNFGLI